MRKMNPAYELIKEEYLEDIKAHGLLLRHKKSGASLALIPNEDENKVFYIGFRTPPADSTGVAHILEHSVLCGSDKYPVKDPFVELVRGSLNTFLNAMTYADKTVYPVASCNDKDFDNLIDVYMDAVLHPRIYDFPEIFEQEGWHYDIKKPEDPIRINGVVYNEMKGAFSSPDDVLDRQVMNSLFPDTPYGVESGGDPAFIPDLTREAFLDFHRRYYHPSNAYLYLYGDFDIEQKLAYLDQAYLSQYEKIELDSEIPLQRPFAKRKKERVAYPIGAQESLEDATYLSYNMVFGTSLNPELYQAFRILDYALLNSPGAPIKQALIEAGIGKEISGGYDSGILQPIFSVVAKGANASDEEKFDQIIEQVLREQVAGGIDKKALYAAINSTQFHLREADYGRYPKGLMWGLEMLNSWLYDKESAFMHMHGGSVLKALESKVTESYFEDLIEHYMLDNPHASMVMLTPEQGLNRKREESLNAKLADYKASLSKDEIEALIAQNQRLLNYQSEEDSEEDLRKIPILQRGDLREKIHPLDCEIRKSGHFTLLHHKVSTNGIHYLNLVFDARYIPAEDLGFLSFLTRVLGMVDTERYTYVDLSNVILLATGGITVNLNNYPRDKGEYRLVLEVRSKFLYEDIESAVRLMEHVMLTSSFADGKRLKELLDEEVARMEDKLMSQGHVLAANRAGSYFSLAGKVSDEINGIGYYRFLKELSDDFDQREQLIKDKLIQLKHAIFRPENLLVSSTADDEAREELERYLPRLEERLYRDHYRLADGSEIRRNEPNEAFASASQVNYVAVAGDFGKEGFAYSGAMRILNTILGYDYFWNNIRVKNGAYGCMSSFTRGGELAFFSYRDPKIRETLDTFRATADWLRTFEADERQMTKYIIGTLSGMDSPLTPSMRGERALTAYLQGLTEEELQRDRDQVIGASQEDIRVLADPIEAALRQGFLCVLGNEDGIEADRELFRKVEQLL